uniref:Uncharacterized protein n=1 Tax=Ditylenchus dipsaci TaxID=166011 RepID=A0A915DSM7_9BILA
MGSDSSPLDGNHREPVAGAQAVGLLMSRPPTLPMGDHRRRETGVCCPHYFSMVNTTDKPVYQAFQGAILALAGPLPTKTFLCFYWSYTSERFDATASAFLMADPSSSYSVSRACVSQSVADFASKNLFHNN